MLTVHQYNARKADIERHAQRALAGLRERVEKEKLSPEAIIERAHSIGISQARDLARLESELSSPEPAIVANTSNAAAQSPAADEILNTHVWSAVPDPELRSLSLPIVHYPIRIVLMGGALGDYAAYVGLGSESWVARHGAKLTFDQARSFFPTIEAERYRS